MLINCCYTKRWWCHTVLLLAVNIDCSCIENENSHNPNVCSRFWTIRIKTGSEEPWFCLDVIVALDWPHSIWMIVMTCSDWDSLLDIFQIILCYRFRTHILVDKSNCQARNDPEILLLSCRYFLLVIWLALESDSGSSLLPKSRSSNK